MSRVKKVWQEAEGPVALALRSRYDEEPVVAFACPQCDRWSCRPISSSPEGFWCPCGAHLRLRVTLRLEELEEEEVKGE